MSIKTYKEATWEAMKEEMLRDPSVYAMAEDIIGNGGSMGHYIGLGQAVGDENRVLDAPISETAIVASAVGAALACRNTAALKIFDAVVCLPLGLGLCGITVALNIPYDMSKRSVSLTFQKAAAVSFSPSGPLDQTD